MRSRNDGPMDPRAFVRMSTDLPLNPKIARMGNPVAAWTYASAICYAGSTFSDGHIPIDAVLRVAGTPKTVVRALVKAGLWHLPGHDCPRCDQPVAGDAIIHDYLQHNRSAADAQGLTDKRRAAGKAGAAKRWSTEPVDGKRIANAMAHATQPLWLEGDDGALFAPPTSSENGNGKVTEPALMTREVVRVNPAGQQPALVASVAEVPSSGIAEGEAPAETEAGSEMASAMASAMANAWQTDSRESTDAKSKSKSKSLSSGDDDEEGFAEVWATLPHRRNDSKHKTRLAYHAARKRGVTHDEILTHAEAYATERHGQDRQFTKGGEAWFNTRPWENGPPVVEKPKRKFAWDN